MKNTIKLIIIFFISIIIFIGIIFIGINDKNYQEDNTPKTEDCSGLLFF